MSNTEQKNKSNAHSCPQGCSGPPNLNEQPRGLPSRVTVVRGEWYDTYQIGDWCHYAEPGNAQSILRSIGYTLESEEKTSEKTTQIWVKKGE